MTRVVGGSVLGVLGIGASWLGGAVIVRLGLDWADTFPYSEASEWRYLAIAVLALSVALAGTVLCIVKIRSIHVAHRRPRREPPAPKRTATSIRPHG